MPNFSISGIPSKTGPFPWTTENLHSLCFLCWIVLLQVANWIMFILSCVHKISPLSLCFANFSIVTLGNKFLNMAIGIKLLPPYVYILYSIFILLCLHLVFSFVIIIYFVMLILNDFIVTASMYLPYSIMCIIPAFFPSCCLSCIGFFHIVYFPILLHFDTISLKCFSSPQLPHVLP